MIIRKARKEDMEKIAELMHEYDLYEHALDKRIKVESLNETKKDIARRFRKKLVTFTIIEADGRIIGVAPWGIEIKYNSKGGMLHDIIITKDFRGKGAGTALFNYVIREMKRKGCKSVKSFVRVKNVKSLQFWKKKGFSSEYAEGYTIRKNI